MFDKEPDLLTRSQCQKLLHVSKNTMLKLIHEGYISARIIAGSYRIEKDSLIEFVKSSIIY